MHPYQFIYQSICHSTYFLESFFQDNTPSSMWTCPEHLLIFIYAGELIIQDNKENISVKKETIYLSGAIPTLRLQKKLIKMKNSKVYSWGSVNVSSRTSIQNRYGKIFPGNQTHFRQILSHYPVHPI